jgi:hypothetical protein
MTTTLRISIKFLCKKYLFIFSLVSLLTSSLYSQTSQIKLLDSKSNMPVSYATVLFVDLSSKKEYFKVSDEKGMVVNPCKNLALVKISCIGYTALTDTLASEKSYDLTLVPTLFS